jgi:putative addiction module component (TIGR02574 family)
MSNNTQKVLSDALELAPIERAELVEHILSSFEFPKRKSLDELWAREVEERISAYEQGKLNTISAQEVFRKIEKK